MKKLTFFGALSMLVTALTLSGCGKDAALGPQPPIQAELTTPNVVEAGVSGNYILTMNYRDDGRPVLPEDIKVVHTERVHLFIVDPSLDDYHHVHPTASEAPGNYDFRLTPQESGEYKVFAEVTLLPEEVRYYIPLTFNVGGSPKDVTPTVQATAEQDGLYFTSYFGDSPRDDQTVVVNRDYMMTIDINDADGNAFTDLEPVMGAFAHMVAFADDRDELVHVHPMGAQPQSDNDRGGPTMKFHLKFKRPGYHRIYAQFQINGQDVFVPFGVDVVKP